VDAQFIMKLFRGIPHMFRLDSSAAPLASLMLLLGGCAPEQQPPPPPRIADRMHLYDFEQDFGYAQAVKVDKTVYVSGVLPVDAKGKLVGPADMAAQLDAVYANLEKVLAAHGVGFNAVVRENLYTTDMEALLQVSDIRFKYYSTGSLPAVTWLEVKRLVDPGFLVASEVTLELP
jgi:enamine deaminase RidA (YjgF/YER057c/UK114 family)